MGLLWHCLPLALLETHGLDTLPTCSHSSSQLERKRRAQRQEVMRERSGELDGALPRGGRSSMKGDERG